MTDDAKSGEEGIALKTKLLRRNLADRTQWQDVLALLVSSYQVARMMIMMTS